MNEVKPPRKPLSFYYFTVLVVMLLLNWFIFPLLMHPAVKETDYSRFVQMADEKRIANVEINDTEIVFIRCPVRRRDCQTNVSSDAVSPVLDSAHRGFHRPGTAS